jgi:hypothetical protein
MQDLILMTVGYVVFKVKLADFSLARAFSIPVDIFSNEVLTLWS